MSPWRNIKTKDLFMKRILLNFIVVLGALALVTLVWVFIFKHISVQNFIILFILSLFSVYLRLLYNKIPHFILFGLYLILLTVLISLAIIHL